MEFAEIQRPSPRPSQPKSGSPDFGRLKVPKSGKPDFGRKNGERERRRLSAPQKRTHRVKRLLAATLALAALVPAAALLWHAPHCRAFAPHRHYVVPGAAMCQRAMCQRGAP
jgi:hypothetical protein